MDLGETITPTSASEWRSWLSANHRAVKEIWVVYFKKKSGKIGLSYDDSVAEALCFGWIDGQMRSVDEDRYAIRFTPRKRRSSWSESNRSRALQLLRDGRMTEAGKSVLPEDLVALVSAQEHNRS